MSTRYGKWQAAYFCNQCRYEMSYYAYLSTAGVCPECGFKPEFRTKLCAMGVRRWRSDPHPNGLLALLGFRVNGQWEYKPE